MTDDLQRRVLDYLREHHVMTLATQGRDGPWAAAVFYVNDGFTLYFLSAPTARHCGDLAANPRVAATIQQDYSDWPQIRGVQLEGIARQVADDEIPRVRSLYGQKYPVVGAARQAPAAIANALAKVRWYRLTPNRLFLVDNSVGFGHRDEVPSAILGPG